MVSVSVSKEFGIEKSIGFGKKLVLEKVSDSVSFRFWVSSVTIRHTLCEILLWGHLLRTPYLVQQKYGAITQKLEMSLARNKI